MPVEQNLPGRMRNKARQQVDQRGLARTRGAHQGNDLARLHLQAHAVEGRGLVGSKGHTHPIQSDGAAHPGRRMAAALFGRCVAHQAQAPFQRGHAPGDRAGHIGQAADGGNQHQHRCDEGHKTAHRHIVRSACGAALPQRHANHRRQGGRRQQLGERRHGRRGDGRFDGQAAQAPAQGIEPAGLRCLRCMQAHHAMGQHVFFDHIGQFVGGLLAALGEVVEATRERLHDPGHARHHHGHDQRELPVQVQQVPQQGQQGEAIARDAQQGLHQQGGAGLHLVHHRIGQGAGRLAGEKTHFGGQQAVEQGRAQRQHAFVGNAGQRILADELGQTADQEDAHDGHGHHPELQ